MNSRLALITFLDGGGGNYPDQGLPSGPNYPSQGLPQPPVDPGYGRPGFGGGNYPSTGPVFPGRPVDPGYGHGGSGNYPSHQPIFPPVTIDNTLPESETTPPSISLPIVLPPQINPVPPGRTRKFELKYSYRYGWVLVPADSDEIDNTLPATPEPK